jgi:lysophospholipase L1-like esterase
VGTTTVTCTTSDAKARSASCTFPVVVLPPPALPVTSFLAFGDSITWGEDGRDATSANAIGQHIFVQLVGQTYPEVLEAELQARYQRQSPTVENSGMRGESLADATTLTPDPATFARFVSLTSSGLWGAVLIMEGSNDVNTAAGDSRVLPPAIAALRHMIDDAKSRGMRVVVATIPPMVPPGADDRARGYQVVPTYNDMVRSLATSEAVPLADVYASFGSDAPALIGFDGLHPNPDGYKRIADTFFATIKSSIEAHETTSRAKRIR